MAVGGVFLAAHNGHAVLSDCSSELDEATEEKVGVGQRVVAHVAGLVVELLRLRPAAELLAEMLVAQSLVSEGALDIRRAEVNRVPRHRA